jgi:hypothetical protein
MPPIPSALTSSSTLRVDWTWCPTDRHSIYSRSRIDASLAESGAEPRINLLCNRVSNITIRTTYRTGFRRARAGLPRSVACEKPVSHGIDVTQRGPRSDRTVLYESVGREYELAACGHYHNAERAGGGLWRLRRNREIEKPRKMGLLGSCRTWIRARTY